MNTEENLAGLTDPFTFTTTGAIAPRKRESILNDNGQEICERDAYIQTCRECAMCTAADMFGIHADEQLLYRAGKAFDAGVQAEQLYGCWASISGELPQVAEYRDSTGKLRHDVTTGHLYRAEMERQRNAAIPLDIERETYMALCDAFNAGIKSHKLAQQKWK